MAGNCKQLKMFSRFFLFKLRGFIEKNEFHEGWRMMIVICLLWLDTTQILPLWPQLKQPQVAAQLVLMWGEERGGGGGGRIRRSLEIIH